MKWAIVSVTNKGLERALEIGAKLGADIYTIPKFHREGAISMEDGFRRGVEEVFYRYDMLLFIMASGIVVRSIAPLIKSKDVDPGVLVMDEGGNFVTSLLSGHLGGANEGAQKIADLTGAVPVVSTASDVSGKIAVDTIAMEMGAKLESLESAKRVTSLIVAGERVELRVPENIGGPNPAGVVVVSNRKKLEISQIIPENIVVGIGCRRDTPCREIMETLEEVFDTLDLHIKSIRLLATVDVKADERGLLELSEIMGKDLVIVARDKIAQIEERFETSEFVRKTIGVGAVSAPAAEIASGRAGSFLLEKHKKNGVTISVYQEETR